VNKLKDLKWPASNAETSLPKAIAITWTIEEVKQGIQFEEAD